MGGYERMDCEDVNCLNLVSTVDKQSTEDINEQLDIDIDEQLADSIDEQLVDDDLNEQLPEQFCGPEHRAISCKEMGLGLMEECWTPYARVKKLEARCISRLTGVIANPTVPEVRCEIDSDADQSVVSSNTALIIKDYERPMEVFGYRGRNGPSHECKTVTGVVAHRTYDGHEYMFHIHQALQVDECTVNLLCPNQMRVNDILVNDEPKCLASEPTDDHNRILYRHPSGDQSQDVRIPLQLFGSNSYFPARVPTMDEYEKSDPEDHIHLTSETLTWEAGSNALAKAEAAMLGSDGLLKDSPRDSRSKSKRMIAAVEGKSKHHGSVVLWDDPAVYKDADPQSWLGVALMKQVNVRPSVTVSRISGQPVGRLKPEELSKRWGITVPVARRTLGATTQRGIRHGLKDGILSRSYKTKDHNLRYRRYDCVCFTDTLQASVPSWFRQNRYCQVYGTQFGWCRAYPMKTKGDAHNTLTLLKKEVGIFEKMVTDGAKEQLLGDF